MFWYPISALQRRAFLGMMLLSSAVHSPAFAKEFEVKVDARSRPWDSRVNSRLIFGIGDGRAPKTIWGINLLPGSKVKFKASGSMAWIEGGTRFGPDGDASLIVDRSLALVPYHYFQRSKALGMGGLVGAFVDADGKVVGTPFAVGEAAEIEVPDNAVAISLGINDDKFSDNDGTFTVSVSVPEATVTVESPSGF